MWFKFVFGRNANSYSWACIKTGNTSGFRIGRVKHGVYWCIYACIGRMSMRCKSSTHGVHNGVITVSIYQSNRV